ncbi:hypothetical protein LTR36_004322 [Oleoguttula mirabilis]|uniref:KTSC domain-containing protein n=1 Tax=Oleoguttula mirabilis TaxID=1507867 RepID=A0AAV9JH40_9PEZI|nr:hypothetical protein LTR36_004322 [Oleoguttula mirabilis]
MPWKQETIDDYHLSPNVLSKFLKGKFGNYDFRIKRGNDAYTFLAPRPLTEDEIDGLDDKRERTG